MLDSSSSLLLKGGHLYMLDASPQFNFKCIPEEDNCTVRFSFANADNRNVIFGSAGIVYPYERHNSSTQQHTATALVQQEGDMRVKLRIWSFPGVSFLTMNEKYSYLRVTSIS
jgi:hypothetical protein